MLFSIRYDSLKSEIECTVPQIKDSKPMEIEKNSMFDRK